MRQDSMQFNFGLLECQEWRVFNRYYLTKYGHTTTVIIAPPGSQPHFSTLSLSKLYRTIDTLAYTCMYTQGIIPILRVYPTPPIKVIRSHYRTVMIKCYSLGKPNANKHSHTSFWIVRHPTATCSWCFWITFRPVRVLRHPCDRYHQDKRRPLDISEPCKSWHIWTGIYVKSIPQFFAVSHCHRLYFQFSMSVFAHILKFRVTLGTSKLSLLLSSRHQTAESFDVFARHPGIDTLLDKLS